MSKIKSTNFNYLKGTQMFAWTKRIFCSKTARLPLGQNARPTYSMPPAPPPPPLAPLYYREIEHRRAAGSQYLNSAAPKHRISDLPSTQIADDGTILVPLLMSLHSKREEPDLNRASAWPPLDEIKPGGGGEFAGGGASGGWESSSSSSDSSSSSSDSGGSRDD